MIKNPISIINPIFATKNILLKYLFNKLSALIQIPFNGSVIEREIIIAIKANIAEKTFVINVVFCKL